MGAVRRRSERLKKVVPAEQTTTRSAGTNKLPQQSESTTSAEWQSEEESSASSASEVEGDDEEGDGDADDCLVLVGNSQRNPGNSQVSPLNTKFSQSSLNCNYGFACSYELAFGYELCDGLASRECAGVEISVDLVRIRFFLIEIRCQREVMPSTALLFEFPFFDGQPSILSNALFRPVVHRYSPHFLSVRQLSENPKSGSTSLSPSPSF